MPNYLDILPLELKAIIISYLDHRDVSAFAYVFNIHRNSILWNYAYSNLFGGVIPFQMTKAAYKELLLYKWLIDKTNGSDVELLYFTLNEDFLAILQNSCISNKYEPPIRHNLICRSSLDSKHPYLFRIRQFKKNKVFQLLFYKIFTNEYKILKAYKDFDKIRWYQLYPGLLSMLNYLSNQNNMNVTEITDSEEVMTTRQAMSLLDEIDISKLCNYPELIECRNQSRGT